MGNIKTGYRLRPVRTVTTVGFSSVPGYPSQTKGLSITQDFSFNRQGDPDHQHVANTGRGGAWVVTHNNTGRRLAPAAWRLTRAQAIALAERLGEFALDWDVVTTHAGLVAWAPGVREYFDGFAEEHKLQQIRVVNTKPFPHEQADAEDAVQVPDAVVDALTASPVNDAARQPVVVTVSTDEVTVPAHVLPDKRPVGSPAFSGTEDSEGRPSPPEGWEYVEAGWDSYVICPCGDTIEQDGKCPAGHVSFLRQWGFI